MKRIFISTILIAAAVLLSTAACNHESSSISEEYSYEFESNCSTGRHTFNSRAAYCAALANHELNNHCACEMRQDRFQRDCPGQTWPGCLQLTSEFWEGQVWE